MIMHTLSISSANPSGNGTAFINILLSLLRDLARHMTLLSSATVSR